MPSNVCSSVSGKVWIPSSHCGYSPASMASARSRRWKSGSPPAASLILFPDQGVHAGLGFPVKLDEGRGAVGRDEAEGVHPEPLHGAERRRDPPVGHVPQGVVLRLGVQRHEVPERVVGGLGLRDLPVRVRLCGVDHVRELDSVLDEEDGNVVPDQVEGALVGVELHREAPGVADGVGGPSGPENGGEPDEHWGLGPLGEEPGLAHAGRRAVAGEHAVRRRATRVDHPLGDALMVEVGDLLAQVVVLQEGGPRDPALSEWSVSGRRTPPAC